MYNSDYLYYKYNVVSLSKEEEDEVKQRMPQFLFYRRHKNEIETYCTICHERRVTDKHELPAACYPLNHNVKGLCPFCCEAVTYKQMGRSRKSYYAWENFLLVRPINEDEVHLDAVGVRQRFEGDIMEPEYEAFLKNQYILTPGHAEKWSTRWCGWGGYSWERVGQCTEPHFSFWVYGYADNSYYTLGSEKLKDTFLKYAISDDYMPAQFTSYLCRFAKHPNIEYLIKGGFAYIVKAILQGGHSIYINYRSNDLKKMLRLNREEINLLKNGCIEDYKSYIYYRKLLPGLCTSEVIRYWKAYKCIYQDAEWLISTYDFNDFKRLLDYIGKQAADQSDHGKRVLMHDYRDYIDECFKLKYDLTSRTVLFPKSLARAHARTTKAMQSFLSAEQQARLEISNKLCSWLPYTDEARGLMVVVPKTVQEIIDEGAKQNHCVGGYAERHAEGLLHILFLRKIDAPDIPYYTMEVSQQGRIMQCRGYANNVKINGGKPKTQDIIDFEKDYQSYLNQRVEATMKKKRKVRESA